MRSQLGVMTEGEGTREVKRSEALLLWNKAAIWGANMAGDKNAKDAADKQDGALGRDETSRALLDDAQKPGVKASEIRDDRASSPAPRFEGLLTLKEAQAIKATSTDKVTIYGASAELDRDAAGDIIRVRMPNGAVSERLGEHDWVSTVKGQLVEYRSQGNFEQGPNGVLQFRNLEGQLTVKPENSAELLAHVGETRVQSDVSFGDLKGNIHSTFLGLSATGDVMSRVDEADLSDGRKLLRQPGIDKFAAVYPDGESLNFNGNLALKGDTLKVVTPFPKNDVEVSVRVLLDGKELVINNDLVKQTLNMVAPSVEGHAAAALRKAGIADLSSEEAESRLKLVDSISTGKSVQIQYQIELNAAEAAALKTHMQSDSSFANYKLEEPGTVKPQQLDPASFVPSGGDAVRGAYEYDSTRADITSSEALIIKPTKENGFTEDMLVVGRRGHAPYAGELAVVGGFFDKGKDGQIENYKMALRREAEEESHGSAVNREESRLSDVYFVKSDPRSNFTADHFSITEVDAATASKLSTGDDMGAIKIGDPVATPLHEGEHSFGLIPLREALANNRLLAFDYAKQLQQDPVHGLPADELALMKKINTDAANSSFEVVGFKTENGERLAVVAPRIKNDGTPIVSADKAQAEFQQFRASYRELARAEFAETPNDILRTGQAPEANLDTMPRADIGRLVSDFSNEHASTDAHALFADALQDPAALDKFVDRLRSDEEKDFARRLVKKVNELSEADRAHLLSKLADDKLLREKSASLQRDSEGKILGRTGAAVVLLVAVSALLALSKSARGAEASKSKSVPFFSGS